MQILDLSHDLTEGMPVYPGTDPPVISPACSVDQDGFSELKLEMFTHTGTHMDAPAHILKKSKTITDLNPDHFLGNAMVVSYSKSNPLTTAIIQELISNYDKPDFILLKCGWDIYWGTETYFSNFPLPDVSVFYYLSQMHLKGIGIDAISVDNPDTHTFFNHRLLLSTNTIIIENLKNLDKLPDGIFEFFCFPLKIASADGSPVRAVARI